MLGQFYLLVGAGLTLRAWLFQFRPGAVKQSHAVQGDGSAYNNGDNDKQLFHVGHII